MARPPKYGESATRTTFALPDSLRAKLLESGQPLGDAIVAAIRAGVAAPTRSEAIREANNPSSSNPASRATRRGPLRYDEPVAEPNRVIVTRGPSRGTNIGGDVSPSSCPHPVTRRIGDHCAGCGATISKGSAR